MNSRASISRTLAAAFTIAALAWAFAFVCREEAATGRVTGQVERLDTGKPVAGADVYLNPESRDWDDPTSRHSRHAVTDALGRFAFSQVRTGEYTISASTEAHSAHGQNLSVSEEGLTQVSLWMERSEPDLRIAQQRRVLTTREDVGLRLRGYADPAKRPHSDTFTVALYRARLGDVLADPNRSEALGKIGSYEPASQIPDVLLKPKAGVPPALVLSRTVRIVEDDREGFFDQRVKFGAMPPGLYLAQVQCGAHEACEALQVTDLALVVKRAANQFLAYTTDLTTGVPVPGALITSRSWKSRSTTSTVTTDASGLAQWIAPPMRRPKNASEEGDEGGRWSGSNERVMIVASRGEDDAVSSNYLYDSEGSGPYAVHVQTDRPIYRPNQTIQYKGICRLRQGDGYHYAVPLAAPVRVDVRDPSGELVSRTGVTTSAMGSFAGHVDLGPEAPTGVYTIVTTIAGDKHTHDVVVASYKKPEFTVTVTPTRSRIVRGEQAEFVVKAEYYFGAPVAGAKVTYRTYGQPDWSSGAPDEEDEEYSEERGWRRRRLYGGHFGRDSDEGEAQLDANGRAVVRVDTRKPPEDSGPIDERLTFSATVTDATGRETEDEGQLRVVQGDLRVDADPAGYLAEPRTPVDVVVSAAPYEGRPTAGVRVELEYGYSKWIRKRSRYSDDVRFDFRYDRAGVVTGATSSDGKALLRIVPPHSGDLRLTARAHDAAGRVVEYRTEVYCTSESTDDLDTEYADLSAFTDKKHYAPGQTARILINALHTGPTALVTVEGERIFRTMSVPLRHRSTIVMLPVLPEYGPNVYVAVCSVRDRKFARTEETLRVDLPDAEINVGIQPDRSAAAGLPRYGPGEPIAYNVTTTGHDGKPRACEFSFGVVDEAIYALQEDNPGAIRSTFYPRRQNNVNTEYSFALEMLGDADKAEPKITARRRFPDTAFWAPFLHTDAQGHARVTFRLPDNLTTWRATAVACSAQTAVGFSANKVLVSKDLLVRLETPRTLTQGDRSTFTAAVHNDTPTARTALVHLTAGGLALLGRDTVTLSVPAHGAATATFEVRADQAGDSALRITAWTPKDPRLPQLTDGIETSLKVLPDGHEVIDVFAGEVGPGKAEHETFRFDPAAVPGFSRLTVRITPSIRAPLGSALEYLVGFPYGCTEQTLSRFVPLVVARHLRKVGLTTVSVKNEDKVVRDGLARLYRFQRDKGYWGWWEQDSVDAWMTSYAVYGLATAKGLGEPVSPHVLERGRKGLLALLPKCTPEQKGFALYALALAGDTRDALADRRALDLAKAPTETLAYVALLDKLTGANPAPVVEALGRRAQTEGALLHWKAERNRWNWSSWSDLMTTSAAVRALVANDPRDPRIAPAVRWLMLHRSIDAWPNTRDTAWVVDALAAVIERTPELADKPAGEIRVALNGSPVRTFALTPDSVREPEMVLRTPPNLLRAGKNDLVLERAGTGAVFYTVEVSQVIPGPPAARGTPPVKITREWFRLTPKHALLGESSLEPVKTKPQFHPGDRVRVRLILDVKQDMSYVIVKEPFAAGCEVNERGSADEAVEWTYWWDGIDVRDDHIAFFAKKLDAGIHQIEYNLTATTAGIYRALPTSVQGMYDPASRADGPAERVEVHR